MVQKRLTKRQMKEDPLLTWTVRIENYFETNLKRIALVALGIAVAVALVFVVRGARRGAESEASELLAQAQFALWSGDASQAATVASQVVERSSGTRSGRMAYLVQGDALLQTGDAEGAITAYRTFLDRERHDDTMRLVARRGLAVALDDAGKYAEAAQAYEELAREGQGALAERRPSPTRPGMPKPEAAIIQDLMSAARSYERTGDPAKAQTLYQEIIDKYPTEMQTVDAKLRLFELEQRTAGSSS